MLARPAKLGRRPGSDDTAALEDRQPINDALSLGHVVRHEQHGRTLVGEIADGRPEQPPTDRVDVVRGLVEDDDTAGLDGRHREGGQPFDTAGELLALDVAPLADVERLDEALTAGPDTVGVATPQLADEVDREPRRERSERQLGLRLERAQSARGRRIGHEIDLVERDRATVRCEQPDDLVDERGLASAVVPEQTEDLAGLDHDRDVVVGHDTGLAAGRPAVGLRQTGDPESHHSFPHLTTIDT